MTRDMKRFLAKTACKTSSTACSIDLPDDERIDPVYRGKTVGVSFDGRGVPYANNMMLRGYTRRYVERRFGRQS